MSRLEEIKQRADFGYYRGSVATSMALADIEYLIDCVEKLKKVREAAQLQIKYCHDMSEVISAYEELVNSLEGCKE
jgi:hypothetical protein